jgi:hypothetical protein
VVWRPCEVTLAGSKGGAVNEFILTARGEPISEVYGQSKTQQRKAQELFAELRTALTARRKRRAELWSAATTPVTSVELPDTQSSPEGERIETRSD